jgi:hypothetical protein
MAQMCYHFLLISLVHLLYWYHNIELASCMEVKILLCLHFASFTTHYCILIAMSVSCGTSKLL